MEKLLFTGFSLVAIVLLLSQTVSCGIRDLQDLQWKETFSFRVAEQAQNSKILRLAHEADLC